MIKKAAIFVWVTVSKTKLLAHLLNDISVVN